MAANATPSASTVAMWRLSSPTPDAGEKNCAPRALWRGGAVCGLLFQVWMGILARGSNTLRGFTSAKLVLASRSLSDNHAPLPAGSETPACGVPDWSTADTKRTPPVARTANSLVADEAKFGGTVWIKSDQTKEPSCEASA